MTILLAMSLFPPWRIVDESSTIPTERPFGYFFIFAPPTPPVLLVDEEKEYYLSMRLDLTRLAVQWITVLFLLSGILYLTHKRESLIFDEED